MADLPVGRYPRLAGPSDIPRLISGEDVIHVWPPPGTTVVKIGTPATWAIVYGTPTVGSSDTWFVTTLAELTLGIDADLAEMLARFAGQFVLSPVALFAGSVGQWPVIYQADRGSITMRWIRVTFRGDLDGVEQFQHKFDLGNPGDDPTIDATAALALAEQLATIWYSSFNNAHGTATEGLTLYTPTLVAYTDVGVAQFHQDTAGSSGDPAGDREQDFPAAWYHIPGTGLTGSSSDVSLPFEVTCAVTLQTDTYGPRGRGRVYLPPPAVNAMGGSGRFDPAYREVAGNAVGDFFSEVISDTPYVPVVVSSRAKELHAITSVNTGTVPDAQRRRRRSMNEARATQWTLT